MIDRGTLSAAATALQAALTAEAEVALNLTYTAQKLIDEYRLAAAIEKYIRARVGK